MNISEEAGLEFRLRKIYETRNNLLDETKHDLMIEKYKKDMQVFKLCSTLSFNFCIYFISLYSCWYYKFYSRNKNLCNHCRIEKV